MDIKSANYWLGVIFIDLKLPQNKDRAIEFLAWFAEHYVLPIEFEHTYTKSDNITTEFVIVSIDKATQTFKRTIKNLIFSIYISEWEKFSNPQTK